MALAYVNQALDFNGRQRESIIMFNQGQPRTHLSLPASEARERLLDGSWPGVTVMDDMFVTMYHC